MRRSRTASLLSFVAVGALAPIVARPVTVVDVSAASGADVLVHGWTQRDGGPQRVAMEPRQAPFQLVFQGSDFHARFVTEAHGEELRVQAVQKRAWIPLVRVASVGPTVSLDGRRSFMGIRVP